MQKETLSEKVTGSLITNSALSLVAASSGMPVAALLPLLSDTFAESRHKKRVEASLKEINKILVAHGQKIQTLSDGQYKLINEVVLAVLQNTNSIKLKYLKNVVKNLLLQNKEFIDDGVFLSRAIRDISADEAVFLMNNFSYKKIEIRASTSEMALDVLKIASNSKNELICSGLISLGLLIPSGPTWDDSGLHKFSNLVAKLIVLLKD